MGSTADGNRLALDAQAMFASISWPELEVISCPNAEGNSCMVMCAGFEDRSLVNLRRMKESGVTGVDLIVVEYLPRYEQNQIGNVEELARYAMCNTQKLVYDREDPAGFGRDLRRVCSQYTRVVVDISAMSRLLIVQTLVSILSESEAEVSVLYAEAEIYPPSRDTVESDEQENGLGSSLGYLSSGVFEIATTPELGSVAMSGEPTRLVAFPSFDPAQLINLVQELQPTYIDLIHGVPPDEALRWRTEAVKRLNRGVLSQRELEKEYYASTLKYTQTLEVLLRIYNGRSAMDRLVLAPTGSKMQAVSVGIFKSVFQDVQIVYPTPQVFSSPEEYTRGIGKVYQFDLPVGLIRDENVMR